MKRLAGAFLFLTLLVGADRSEAALITYTFSGTGSGQLGAESFTDALFTISAVADTDDIFSTGPGVLLVPTIVTSFEIVGIGSGTLLNDLEVFVNQAASVAGLSGVGPIPDILDVANPELATYDLASTLAPVLDPGPPFWLDFSQPTTAGQLVFHSTLNVSFSAELAGHPVPEPSTVILVGLGMAVVALVPRVSRRRTVA